MHADLAVATALALRKCSDVTVSLPGPVGLRGILDLLDEVSQQSRIPALPEKYAISRLTVAPGAPGLLDVRLQARRMIVVQPEPDLGSPPAASTAPIRADSTGSPMLG